jgi:hypothetical protein
MSLHSAVRRTVIDVLDDFGSVTCTYHDHPLVPKSKELDAFKLTPLGVALLDSLLVQGS